MMPSCEPRSTNLERGPMSYNVAICTQPIPISDQEAWQAVDALIDAKGEPPEVIRELHDCLTTKYSCICTLSDDEVDNRVWSDGMTSAVVLPCWEWSIHG